MPPHVCSAMCMRVVKKEGGERRRGGGEGRGGGTHTPLTSAGRFALLE